MEKNLFDVKYRIFKRERAREGKNNLVIIPKNNKIINKNQLEFVWTNKKLERDHLLVLGSAMVSEWGRILPNTIISRAFIQIKEAEEIRFYISFQVEDSLTSEEIKEIILKSLMALNECLEKVTKKVIGIQEFNQLFSLDKYQTELNSKDSQILGEQRNETPDKTEDYQLIQKLQTEIEMQEELLKQLDEQQKQQSDIKRKNSTSKLDQEEVFKEATETIEQLYKENTVLEKTIESLTRDVILADETRLEVEKNNQQLKKEFDKLQEKWRISEKSQEKLTVMEKKVQSLMQQNSDYRIKLVENQSIIDQYTSKNKYLKESVEKTEQEKKDLVELAQKEHEILNKDLGETSKNLIVVTNKYQKNEETIGNLRKKLAEATLDYEEKIEQLNNTMNHLASENEQFLEINKELKQAKEQVSQLEQDLKMAETTISVLRERKQNTQGTSETISQSEKWRQEYQELLAKYSELEQEGYNYRQEINLLNSQLLNIQAKFESIGSPLASKKYNQFNTDASDEALEKSINHNNQKNQTSIEIDSFNVFVDEDDDYQYFPYEADPYIEEVKAMSLNTALSSSQEANQKKIRNLLSSNGEEMYGFIKVEKSEYKRYLLDLKFLSYRWSQISSRKNVDVNTEFLDWCAPFIKRVELFEEELETKVKKAFLAKNVIVINESVYRILKGYSMLSVYLDTYYFLN